MDSNGVVTAVSEGTTAVFAHAEGVSASCIVTVGKNDAGNGDTGDGNTGGGDTNGGNTGGGNAGSGNAQTPSDQLEAETETAASSLGTTRRPPRAAAQAQAADGQSVAKTHEGTGITLFGGIEEAWELSVEIVQAEAEKTSPGVNAALSSLGGKYAAYDITLLHNGAKVQPRGSVEVRMPIPEGFDKERLEVYYIPDEGGQEALDFAIEGEFVVFLAEHFSIYVVAERAQEAEPEETQAQPEEPSPEESASEDVQPKESAAGESGMAPMAVIVLAVAVAAAAIGAGAYVYYKKKKKEE